MSSAKRLCRLVTFGVTVWFSLVSNGVSSPKQTTPEFLRYEIYSDTAAELFWLRESLAGIRGYQVSRNGTVLGEFDALSYFDDTLIPGIEYTFSVTTINQFGDPVGVSTVTLQTPKYADTIATLEKTNATLESRINRLEDQLDSGVGFGLAQTGQTVSYQPGDDGDLQVGIASPDPRFTDNDNGTFTDNLTRLVWLSVIDCIV